MPIDKLIYDCIVIGGGPGGLVSAIYLKRFRRQVRIVARDESRVKYVPVIRNLIGYADGISGRKLLHRLYKQAHNYKRRSKGFMWSVTARNLWRRVQQQLATQHGGRYSYSQSPKQIVRERTNSVDVLFLKYHSSWYLNDIESMDRNTDLFLPRPQLWDHVGRN